MLFQSKRLLTRISAFALALVMVLSLMPMIQVNAIETESVDKSKYHPDNEVNSIYGYIRNSYIEACITDDGHYTIGTVEGDPNSDTDDHRKLLYGHPGSTTTETLVRIDGTDYFFDNYVTDIRLDQNGNQATATAMINGVQVKQILTLSTNPYTNIEDLVTIRYTYRNTTSYPKQVGIRIMLDTMLGGNDGAPFRVNGQDVTKEIEFTGNNIPQYWQSFDSLSSPDVTASGFFYFNDTERPDKVQFVAWPHIRSKGWNVTVNSSAYVTGDSAVAAYFNPRTVAAGGSYSVVTYYGISGFSSGNSDLDGEIAARITAPSELSGSDISSGYLNNPFDVSVYMTNQGTTVLENVKAVLDLSNAPQLSLDSSQATTIRVGDMYAAGNAAIQWTLRALPQSEDTNVTYTVSFYSGNTLLKTMDVALVLKALAEEDSYCYVNFDLNGAPGAAPAAQRVAVGDRVTKPADPTWDGYVFEGWYSNSSCTGSKWFNLFNLYRGNVVTQNITLYAKWSRSGELVYGSDTFDFENSRNDFFGNNGRARYYMLSGDYYDILMEGRSSSEQSTLLDVMESTWGGSCFGMSCVLALVYAGDLDVDYFQTGADVLHDFDNPKSSETIFNLINYYHVMQVSNRTARARSNYNSRVETSNNRGIIEALDESDYPVVIGFDINYDSNGRRMGGHAVVAYKYTQDDDGYDVYIWDPNDKDEPIILYISSDYKTSYFIDTWYDDNTYNSYMKYALTVEDGNYDYRNIQQELMDAGYSSGSGANALDNEAADGLALYTNYDCFKITASNGEYALVENGIVTEGSLSITDAEFLNEIGTEQSLLFVINEEADFEYTVEPEETVSVVTGEELLVYTTTLVSNAADDGFYASLNAETAGTVIFGADGTVSTDFAENAQKVIEVVANDANTAWDAVAVATSSNLSVTPDSDATVISSQEDAEILVGASDGYNSVEFDSMTVEANDDLSLTEDAENPGTALLGDQTAVMGHSVIFFTKGGTLIEAQTDITSGELAVRPEDPTRFGFVFAGWYTTEACADGEEFDFDTPITEDTRIYAKWLTDINATHTVTFRAAGHDDVVIIVRDGDSLTEEQIPAVPEKENFIGAWDITDFSNITADMIVNAIYTSNLPGDADGNGTVNTRDAMMILQFYADIISAAEVNANLCDVDGNGTVNTRDAMLVLQYYAGLITRFPVDG